MHQTQSKQESVCIQERAGSRATQPLTCKRSAAWRISPPAPKHLPEHPKELLIPDPEEPCRAWALQPTSYLPHVDGEQRRDVGAVGVLVQDPVAAIWKDERWSLEAAQLCWSHSHSCLALYAHSPTGLCSCWQQPQWGLYLSLPSDEMGSLLLPSCSWAAGACSKIKVV